MNENRSRFRARKKAFTLIELLIVVAIIASLAAIAVPNFLEAQVRSKASRSRADMRTIVTGIEAYRVEWNIYPPTFWGALGDGQGAQRLTVLTTPIAFITSLPVDVFSIKHQGYGSLAGGDTWAYHRDKYIYVELQNWVFGRTYQEAWNRRAIWFLGGRGPDYKYTSAEYMAAGFPANCETEYDPTNGTKSMGDIERFGP